MTRYFRLLLALALVVATSLPAAADDKDFLRPLGTKVPPNLLIVFGNSQTMTQTISSLSSATSTWDGDADSPASKLGSAKRVIQQFISDFHTSYNIGLTTFAHNPNAGSIDINQKHWVYESLNVDFPNDSFKEPAGTLERWGPSGEGPCTSKTVPDCTDRSPNHITFIAPFADATFTNPFFGANPTATTYAYLVLDSSGNPKKRIRMHVSAGAYGDAFTDGTFSTLMIGGTHSIEVTKEYQTCNGSCGTTSGGWSNQQQQQQQ